MNIVGIVPARMASSRFPDKPMAGICGMPMIGHVYFRCKMSRLLNEVYVATCDREIADYITSIGGKAIMTMDTHERASDRCSEALLKIEEENRAKADVVVMIQGDEPMIVPEMIDAAVEPMCSDPSIGIVNLTAPIKTRSDQDDPNTVKVVMDERQDALYFSREPIPSWKKGAKTVPMYKQVSIMPFRREFLIKFAQLAPTPLEIVESVDMLRFLEHGYKVRMVICGHETYSVDTVSDLERVEKLMRNDELYKRYAKRKA